MTDFIIAFALGLTIVTGLVVILMQRLYVVKARDLEERNRRLTALRKVDQIMMSSITNVGDVAQKITDAISFELGFEVGVIALIDEENRVLKRVAMSETPTGIKAKQVLPIPYEKLNIPLDYDQNLSIKVIKTGKMQITHNLYDIFMPIFDQWLSTKIQQTVGVKTSMIYPLRARGKIIGVMIVSIGRFEDQLSTYEKESIENLVDFVAVALDNAILYQNLIETSKKLEQANVKLQDLDNLKDDFVSITSHELRTPMTAIRSYVWMALHRSDIPLSQKLARYLYRTLISTERLINLVNDLLNISRIEAGRIEINPEVVDIVIIIQDVLEEIRPKIEEKGIKIIISPGQVPKVLADSSKIRQVLLNLIGNALKFTPSEGSITFGFLADGLMLDITVKDTGPGISRDDLGRLFQKFGRLDNSYVAMGTSGGTGLGLYISKKLVELMKGRIWVSSEGLGKGATFTFSLPIANQEILAQKEKFRVRPVGEIKELEPVVI